MADVEGLGAALSLAPNGARCRVGGFEDWKMTPYGWQQQHNGWLVSSEYLAELIVEQHPDILADPESVDLEPGGDRAV